MSSICMVIEQGHTRSCSCSGRAALSGSRWQQVLLESAVAISAGACCNCTACPVCRTAAAAVTPCGWLEQVMERTSPVTSGHEPREQNTRTQHNRITGLLDCCNVLWPGCMAGVWPVYSCWETQLNSECMLQCTAWYADGALALDLACILHCASPEGLMSDIANDWHGGK